MESPGGHHAQEVDVGTDERLQESPSLLHGLEHRDTEKYYHVEISHDLQTEDQEYLDDHVGHQPSEKDIPDSRSDNIHIGTETIYTSVDEEHFRKKDQELETGLIEGNGKKREQDVQADIAEMKEMLSRVLKTQDTMLNEIRALREDNRRNSVALTESLESNRCVCKNYTDAQVRTLECRVNGLAAVLEHVQTRYMETEIQQHETEHEYESISSSDSNSEQQVHEDMMAQIHEEERNRNWLRQHHLNLVENINPKHDLLLDRLSQDNVLSVSDEEKILSHTTRKHQARELVIKLRRCSSSQFETFMKHLESEHPHLAMLSSVDNDTGETDHEQKCVVCDVTKLVDVDDVIDYVYQQGFLDGVAYEAVWKTEQTEERWCRLLDKLTNKSDGFQVLVDALSKKYPLMSQRLSLSRQISLECTCSPESDLIT